MVSKCIDTCRALINMKKQAHACMPLSLVLSVQERKMHNAGHVRSDHIQFHKNNPISFSNTFVSHVMIHIRSVRAFKNTTNHVCVQI